MNAADYPEFLNRWDPGVDVEALVGTFWNIDGPHSPERTASAALAVDQLTRYLAHATFPGRGAVTLPHGGDVYRQVGEWRSTIGRLQQVLEQLARRAGELAEDPTLYDDRRGDHRPAVTALEAQAALEEARQTLAPLDRALGAAHNASGHLGHQMAEQ